VTRRKEPPVFKRAVKLLAKLAGWRFFQSKDGKTIILRKLG
jgi:hypothetical protein